MTIIEQKWTKKAKTILLNKKIIKVEYLTQKESEEMNWSNRPLCFMMDDGTWIIPSTDDEGNNGGALHTNNENEPILPVL